MKKLSNKRKELTEKELQVLDMVSFAMEGKPSANFSAEDVTKAGFNALMEYAGVNIKDGRPSYRDMREHLNQIFSITEIALEEILPERLKDLVGAFAEVKTFDEGEDIEFTMDKIGRSRAKLVISRGANAGIYRAARLDGKRFHMDTHRMTAAVSGSLEELARGTYSLADMLNDIVEGYSEEIIREIYAALATATPLTGYNRIGAGSDSNLITTTTSALTTSLDKVISVVQAYGVPTIFGFINTIGAISNPLVNTAAAAGYPNSQDSMDIREHGFVQMYKGVRVVQLPNYLVDNGNDTWFYDPSYVFVLPGDIKPVKVAFKGEARLRINTDALGGEKWESERQVGVALASANNFSVIKCSDVTVNVLGRNATDFALDK
jgi:hypothetical protein